MALSFLLHAHVIYGTTVSSIGLFLIYIDLADWSEQIDQKRNIVVLVVEKKGNLKEEISETSKSEMSQNMFFSYWTLIFLAGTLWTMLAYSLCYPAEVWSYVRCSVAVILSFHFCLCSRSK